MIVISSTAAGDADRLADQSTLLKEPVKLVGDLLDETLLMLTSIDGALLINPKGTCYAVGAFSTVSRSRGKEPAPAGQDITRGFGMFTGRGMTKVKVNVWQSSYPRTATINLVRELREQIKRSEITAHLEKVQAAVAGETVNAKEYYKAIFWLSDHRFYLSPDECNQLNQLKEATRLRLIEQEGGATAPADFEADEEMDDTYFLAENGDDQNGSTK